MAQRSKKQTRKSPAVENAAVYSAAPAASPSGSSRSFSSEFNPDYSQTIKDLKRIATLASIFFAILVVLAFVLP